MKNLLLVIIALGIFINPDEAFAQEPLKPRPSPLELVTMKYEDTYVKITYCRPSKKGREIFGGLVPYGEVWRTGANEATEITITGDIKIGSHELKAGTYSMFTIPEEKEWTIIINSDLGQWGSFRYNAEHDVLRFNAKTEKTDQVYEPFTIEFEQTGTQKTNLLMIWDRTRVIIPIEFL
ncbi:MAG: DUF2911 domain-containing protein [Bacteroidetes bacterium]|nr:DUF2911 domain-containing protein [Bacteroidota bacterium]